MSTPTESPCIGICKLDPAKVCIGCGRHVDEVIAWPYSTDDERRAIVAAARKRLAERGRPVAPPGIPRQ